MASRFNWSKQFIKNYTLGGKIMKKLFFILIALITVLAGCSNEEPKDETEKIEEDQSVENGDASDNATEEDSGNTIDTSMFEYTVDIEVTDALDVNDHITVMLYYNEELQPGMAFQHAANHSYEFLQQETVKEAKTIGINVVQGDKKLIMFTIHPEKFEENDEVPMANLVMEASIVEMIQPEVEEYAEIMEIPIHKE